jgi:predicted MPP superfamily phosphohydrolase
MRFLLTVTTLTHIPFVIGFSEGLRRLGVEARASWAIAALLAAFGIYFFVGRAKNMMNDSHRPWTQTFLVDVPYFAHWAACIYCAIPSILYSLGALVTKSPIEAGFFLWCYLSGLVVCGYGVTIRRWFFITRHVDVPVRGLDKDLDGYTIVHLSDMHIGAMTPKWWGRRWIDRANEERADAVVVTGDMVTSGVAFHEDIAELVGALEAKDGVFVSMGNHDYFGEGEPLIGLLVSKGARVLRNEGLVIDRTSDRGAGARFFLSAIDDTWTKRANLDRALEARPDGMTTVLLAHDPDRFPQAAKKGVDLVLSGHTHGGQIAVPFVARHINASKLAHHYHLGLYEDGDARLYVHPGLGTTGPPIRLGVAPAVVVLRLRST